MNRTPDRWNTDDTDYADLHGFLYVLELKSMRNANINWNGMDKEKRRTQ